VADTPANRGQKETKPQGPGTVGRLKIFGIPVRLHFTFLLLLVFLIFIGFGGSTRGPRRQFMSLRFLSRYFSMKWGMRWWHAYMSYAR